VVLGSRVRLAGSVPESVVTPFTSSHEFALVAVAVKVTLLLVLDTATVVAVGKVPAEVYVHGTEVGLIDKLPLDVTVKLTCVSSVMLPTVTLRMPA
jgi:hypothetical protein